jgi:hypothetical protein
MPPRQQLLFPANTRLLAEGRRLWHTVGRMGLAFDSITGG